MDKHTKQTVDDDDLIQSIDDMENKLNLTADEKDDGNEIDINDEKIEQEYLSFMKSLQGEVGNENQDMDPMVGQLTNMMSDLLKNINEEAKDADQPNNDKDMQEKMKSMFEKMENNPQFEQFANQLLYQFMDKEILQEPLKEAKVNYEKYLDKNKDNLPKEEYERFRNQEKCILEILEKINVVEAVNKEELVKLFEKMQEYGNPPEEVFGADSPLALINNLNSQENQQTPQGGPEQQDCSIF